MIRTDPPPFYRNSFLTEAHARNTPPPLVLVAGWLGGWLVAGGWWLVAGLAGKVAGNRFRFFDFSKISNLLLSKLSKLSNLL